MGRAECRPRERRSRLSPGLRRPARPTPSPQLSPSPGPFAGTARRLASEGAPAIGVSGAPPRARGARRWIPAPRPREDRLRGSDGPHGVCPRALRRHSREGANPRLSAAGLSSRALHPGLSSRALHLGFSSRTLRHGGNSPRPRVVSPWRTGPGSGGAARRAVESSHPRVRTPVGFPGPRRRTPGRRAPMPGRRVSLIPCAAEPMSGAASDTGARRGRPGFGLRAPAWWASSSSASSSCRRAPTHGAAWPRVTRRTGPHRRAPALRRNTTG